MLYTQTLQGETLRLLKTLLEEDELSEFSLVGGTALALYLGHRRSVDIDLFTQKEFDSTALCAQLKDKYGFREDFVRKNTLKGTIEGVKIDCITILTTR